MKRLVAVILFLASLACAQSPFTINGTGTIQGIGTTGTINVPSTPKITTASCPSGTQNIVYPGCTLAATGGATVGGQYCWTTDFALPAGLTLAGGVISGGVCSVGGSGLISGTPTTVQTNNFNATVTDANGLTAIKALSITINAANTLQLQPGTLSIGVPNNTYSALLVATGGAKPYQSCAITSGALPATLSISVSANSGCSISGTVTAAVNNYTFTARITDNLGVTASQTYTITVTNGAAADDNYYDDPASVGLCRNGLGVGHSDTVAALPQACMNTAVANTPSPGSFVCVLPNGQTPPATCSGSAHNYLCTPDGNGHCVGGVAAAFADMGGGHTIQCGWTIKLVATDNGTASGNQIYYADSNTGLTYPALQCDNAHWVTVESDMIASIPEGTRVSPAWIGVSSPPGSRPNYSQPAVAGVYMPKLTTTTYSKPTLTLTPATSAGAPYTAFVRFAGIEFVQPNPSDSICSGHNCVYQWFFFLFTTNCDTAVTCPDHVILDRSILGADDTTGNAAYMICDGFQGAATYMAIIDSYFWQINNPVGLGSCNESHAITFGNTTATSNGPYKIVNNYIEGGGLNMLSGGAIFTASTPTDVEIRRNHFYQAFNLWMPNQPGYIGTAFLHKNASEFKNIARALFEGNIYDYSWYGKAPDGVTNISDQFGQGLTLNSSVQQGIGPYRANDSEVTVRYNLLRHMAKCIFVDSSGSPGMGNLPPGKVAPFTQDVSIHDNVCDDMGGRWQSFANSLWAGDGSGFTLENSIIGVGTNGTLNNINISHNTVIGTSYQLQNAGTVSAPIPPLTVASITVSGTTATLTAVTGPTTNLSKNTRFQIWQGCAGFNQNGQITAVTQQGTASVPAIFTYTTSATGTCNSGSVAFLNSQGGTIILNEGASDTPLTSLSESGTTAKAVATGWPHGGGVLCIAANTPSGCTGTGTFTLYGLTGSLACYNSNQAGCPSGTTPATWTTTGFIQVDTAGCHLYGVAVSTDCPTATNQIVVYWTHPSSGLSAGNANGSSYISWWSNFSAANYGPNPNPVWQGITAYGNIFADRATKAGGACETSPCSTSKDLLANSGIVATSGPGAYVYLCNLQPTQQLIGQTIADALPAGNADTQDHTYNTVGFNNYNWDNLGQGVTNLLDLQLAPSSPFKFNGTSAITGCNDTRDPGADIPSVISYTAAVP